ncbi:MAG TPA: hypothetical protein DC050_10440, partial [Pseudomonas sp.]|nr:hypothetical protein [Pseudomonas sp.]
WAFFYALDLFLRQLVAPPEARITRLWAGLYRLIALSLKGVFFTIWRIFRGPILRSTGLLSVGHKKLMGDD